MEGGGKNTPTERYEQLDRSLWMGSIAYLAQLQVVDECLPLVIYCKP